MTASQSLLKKQLAAFGTNLKWYRLRNEWTLAELARHSGLSKPFLSRLESGARQPSLVAVLTLSQVFGVSPASMFEAQASLKKGGNRVASSLRIGRHVPWLHA
jgi:transcriptional regulator with XRE-family HTH domain